MKAVIFDRDGTLMEHVHYPHKRRHVRLVPGAHRLWDLKARGVLLFLHTNQSGVYRGYMTTKQVDDVQDEFLQQLGGNPFEEIKIAMEAPDLNLPDSYRKPSPKFINEVLQKYQLFPKSVAMVGDSQCDMMAAELAGIRGILIKSDRFAFDYNLPGMRCVIPTHSLASALNLL